MHHANSCTPVVRSAKTPARKILFLMFSLTWWKDLNNPPYHTLTPYSLSIAMTRRINDRVGDTRLKRARIELGPSLIGLRHGSLFHCPVTRLHGHVRALGWEHWFLLSRTGLFIPTTSYSTASPEILHQHQIAALLVDLGK